VRIKGSEQELETKKGYEGVCFVITRGKGGSKPPKYVALVKVPGGSKYGRDVFRYATVLDESFCRMTYKLPRNVPKNKFGKKEFAKVVAFKDGERAAVSGKIVAKILSAKKKKTVKGIVNKLKEKSG